MQWRAVIWILGAFHTSPTIDIKAIAGLIPIHLYLQKLSSRFQLRMQSLPTNHIFKSMLESRHLDNNSIYHLSVKKLTPKQWLNVKGFIVDANNRLNGVFPSFIPFNSEFLPGNRLIDIYSSHFSFHSINKHEKDRKVHIWKLGNLTLQVSDNSKIAIIIFDVSIKNQVATLIAYIMSIIIQLSKLFIIQSGSHLLRLNFSLLDITSIKPLN